MENEKLLNDVKTIVEGIFSDKEQAGQMQKTQDALNESAETIDNLTQKLEETTAALATEQETATRDNEEKDSKISELQTELEAAQKKVEEAEAKLASTTESLENIKKDQLAEARMNELKDDKVAMTNDLKAQAAKVRELSEEEFASYKEDRIALRQAVEKELEEVAKVQAKVVADAVQTNTDSQEDEETASTEGSTTEEEGTITPPANIAPGQAMAAAMNFETKPSDDMVEKYANLGKEMASLLTPKKSDK